MNVLEKLVIKKTEPTTTSDTKQPRAPPPLPQQIDFNLRDPSFKYKGLKKKGK